MLYIYHYFDVTLPALARTVEVLDQCFATSAVEYKITSFSFLFLCVYEVS